MNSSEQEVSAKNRNWAVKFAMLTVLLGIPLGVIVYLSITVLLPALNNPESRIYFSGIGVPARQRSLGESIPVQTVPVKLQNWEETLASPGESVPLQQVNIRPLVSGTVAKVYVVEGDLVRQGQPLIQLNQIPFTERVNQAKNSLAIAEKSLQALEASSPSKLLELENNVKIASSRFVEAKVRAKEMQALAEREKKNNVAIARSRLEIAEKKLKQIETLAEKGAVSQFKLYELQDIYENRKKEFYDALRGEIGNEERQFNNQDFYLMRQNELIASEQALKFARQEFEKQLATIRLEIESLKIQLSEAVRNLDRTVIYAENDGLVSQVNIHQGEVADANSDRSLMVITKDVVFKAYIDQARLNAVKIGDSATVHLVAFPGKSYQGKIVRLNPTVETKALQALKVGVDRQYTYSVWVSLNSLEIPPGLQGFARFSKAKQSTLVIPESAAIHLSRGEGMVMVDMSGKATIKQVKFGRNYADQREVLAGLEAGEKVVLHPKALQPGDVLKSETIVTKDEVKK
jgi:HlyD family secretion protein